MAHAQKPGLVFRWNGRVHLNRRGASVQSTAGSRGVRISGSNAGHTMFRGSVKSTGYQLHSPVSPSLPLPCVTMRLSVELGRINEKYCISNFNSWACCAFHHHHHHHVPEGLGVFFLPYSSRWSWSLHLFLGRPMLLRPFCLYCSACFGSLFVSILCTCCSHSFWYRFISFAVFCYSIPEEIKSILRSGNACYHSVRNFLTSCKTVSFSRRTLHHGVSMFCAPVFSQIHCFFSST